MCGFWGEWVWVYIRRREGHLRGEGREGGNIPKTAITIITQAGSQPDFLISLCNCAFQLITLQPFPSPRFRFPTHPTYNWHFCSTCINKDSRAKKAGTFLPLTRGLTFNNNSSVFMLPGDLQ